MKCFYCTIADCDEPPSQAGYSATKDGTTVEGQTATVTCDTGNGWSGSPPVISCVVGGWEALSGCSQSGGGGGGIDLRDKKKKKKKEKKKKKKDIADLTCFRY